MPKSKQSRFRFLPTDTIGAAGAEDDKEFLAECFLDTGLLALLEDQDDNRTIVLGRTGTGKTALLQQLVRRHPERAIQIEPRDLALAYVSNSTILDFFTQLGVNFDPFFSLLWRHVLTVEVLHRHFQQFGSTESRSLLEWLRDLVHGRTRKGKSALQFVDYLERWGRKFWQETEFRVKEITRKVETDLEAQIRGTLGTDFVGLSARQMAGERLGVGEKGELVSRAQHVVSQAQVQDLQQVFSILGEVFHDRQKRYYIVIDGLDENWVEEHLRYRLIMALIQTVRDFNSKVKNVKVILSLRHDLIERVFRITRDSGFQKEKYQSLYLPLLWNHEQILEVLERRVAVLVSRRYTKRSVSFRDLLPRTVRDVRIDDYIYAMAKRPRDVIALFNACINAAPSQTSLSERRFLSAVAEYSRGRLDALYDEWHADYPELPWLVSIMNGLPSMFKLSKISSGKVGELCLEIATDGDIQRGDLYRRARDVAEGVTDPRQFIHHLFYVFYRVGLVGLKTVPYERAFWADLKGQVLTPNQISDLTSAVVNPPYVRPLGVLDRRYDVRIGRGNEAPRAVDA